MDKHKKKINSLLIIISCSGMAAAALGIAVNSAGVFFTPIAESLGVGLGDVSMFMTIQNILVGVASPFAVKAAEKYGARIPLCIGGMVTLLSYAGMALATQVWQLYVLAAVRGVALAQFGMPVIFCIIHNWMPTTMGTVSGIAMCFSGIVGAVMSPVLSGVIAVTGWQSAALCCGVLSVVLLLPAMLIIRLHPEGDRQNKGADESAAAAKEPGQELQIGAPAKEDVVFLALCVAGACGSFITGMGAHMSGYAESVGLNALEGAYLISAVMAGNTVSKLVLGVLCDRIGSKYSCCIIFAVTFIGLMLLLLPGSGWIVRMIAAFMVGCIYSAASVGIANVAKDLFQPQRFGVVNSYISLAGTVSSAAAFSVIGYSVDLTSGYVLAIIGCGCIAAVSIGCLFAAENATRRYR